MKPVDKPVFLLLEFPPDEAADADHALAAARNMPGFDRRFLPERRATLRLPLEKATACSNFGKWFVCGPGPRCVSTTRTWTITA